MFVCFRLPVGLVSVSLDLRWLSVLVRRKRHDERESSTPSTENESSDKAGSGHAFKMSRPCPHRQGAERRQYQHTVSLFAVVVVVVIIIKRFKTSLKTLSLIHI